MIVPVAGPARESGTITQSICSQWIDRSHDAPRRTGHRIAPVHCVRFYHTRGEETDVAGRKAPILRPTRGMGPGEGPSSGRAIGPGRPIGVFSLVDCIATFYDTRRSFPQCDPQILAASWASSVSVCRARSQFPGETGRLAVPGRGGGGGLGWVDPIRSSGALPSPDDVRTGSRTPRPHRSQPMRLTTGPAQPSLRSRPGS